MSNDNTEVFARLFKLWTMICKMIMDGKRDAKAVADMLQRIVDGPVIKKVLTFLGNITVPLAPKSELEQFTFKTRKGLWVDSQFTKFFGKSVSHAGGSIELGKYQLIKDASDSTIMAELKPGFTFKGETGKEKLKQVIASLILAQSGGADGILINNTGSNIFYFEWDDDNFSAVTVDWDSDARKWGISGSLLDEGGWCAEDVVFSRSTSS